MQFIIFHGAFGSKDGNWFPWLKKELEKGGHKVILDQYPIDDIKDIEAKGKENTDTIQNLNSWIGHFKNNALPKIDRSKPLILIGHSLAPLFILHLVDRFDLKLNSAIFVSSFLDKLEGSAWQFNVVNKTFFKTDFNWKKLKTLISQSYVLYGENDPYVPAVNSQLLADKLGSSVIPVKNGGHLGGDFKELPIVLELIKTRLG